jgi:hypothetical protein
MERMEAHKLQPNFIEAFSIEAFRGVGGKIRPREKGRHEITSVPFAVRNRDMQIGFGEHVLQRYERVCFDKKYCNIQGLVPAALIAPGHPLLEAVISLVRERNADVLKRGAVFIDDSDFSLDARLLFYIDDSVQDGIILLGGGKRVISKHIHFVELKEDGSALDAGYAPYLDYRAAKEDEIPSVRRFLDGQQWLKTDVEDTAVGYAVSEVIPAHVAEVRERKLKMINKTVRAVKERLTAEINHWDIRAGNLRMKESAGKAKGSLNSQMAARRAEELEMRMQKRLAELESEKLISATPPVIVGGAVVIPRGLLNKLTGRPDTFAADAKARREVEFTAMKTVMEIEKSLGFDPKDVSGMKKGYDIESWIPENKRNAGGSTLRFIEVKGRAAGAGTVTVSKNEIHTALNTPDKYILAIVEVNGLQTKSVYLKKPFRERPDFAATSVNYNIVELVGGAEIVFQE